MRFNLRYNNIGFRHDTINIGFIASYLKSKLKDKISIELFKYPNDLLSHIKKQPPDILGLSNYSWNSNLSENFAKIAKKFNPNCVVLQGGTNFPHETDQQKISSTDLTQIFTLCLRERDLL